MYSQYYDPLTMTYKLYFDDKLIVEYSEEDIAFGKKCQIKELSGEWKEIGKIKVQEFSINNNPYWSPDAEIYRCFICDYSTIDLLKKKFKRRDYEVTSD